MVFFFLIAAVSNAYKPHFKVDLVKSYYIVENLIALSTLATIF